MYLNHIKGGGELKVAGLCLSVTVDQKPAYNNRVKGCIPTVKMFKAINMQIKVQ